MLSFRSIGVIALLSAGLMTAACVSTRTQQAPGEYVDDSVLTTKVKAALFDDPVHQGAPDQTSRRTAESCS